MVIKGVQECLKIENLPFSGQKSKKCAQGYVNLQSTTVDLRRKAEELIKARRKSRKGDRGEEQKQSLPFPQYKSLLHVSESTYTHPP